MNLKGKHLMSPDDYTLEELQSIIDLAGKMVNNREDYGKLCEGKILATCFYEPSTRTRLSFESAMLCMGGKVLGFSDASTSSVSKGESVADTIRVIASYADIVAMRHPVAGNPQTAAKYSKVPVINAGDGGNQHPTQTLTDMVTISQYKGGLNNLTIAFCGDLKYGRTVHSLITTLNRYENNQFILISPEELKLPEEYKALLKQGSYVETTSLEAYMPQLDVLYMTRIQRERFADIEQYNRLKDSYILNRSKLETAKTDMMVLHPLPRVNEIDKDVDADPRGLYFKQAELGVYARMALIARLLGLEK